MAVVSIIVPVYNTPGNWFRECMESVSKQSWKDCNINDIKRKNKHNNNL